jgi:hypothetical protein
LEAALRTIPWRGRPGEAPPSQLRVVFEDEFGRGAEIRNDVPLTFDDRVFAHRCVVTRFLNFEEVADPCGSLG